MDQINKEKYLEGVTKLGSNTTEYKYDNPTIEILETFPNLNGEFLNCIKVPEFTSLCPKTGQPDFATIYIQYVPDKKCVESKSLKLYMFAFRNFGSFMEDITSKICSDLYEIMNPRWIRVIGDFYSRGGISIVPVKELLQLGYDLPNHWKPVKDLHTNHMRVE